jgi:putative acetyltransferase
MASEFEIRTHCSSDLVAILELYPNAFPDEDLRPLVADLLVEKTGVVSLIASVDELIVGHGLFTICRVSGRHEDVSLLGPLVVAPRHQRQGMGSAMVREGLRLLSDAEVSSVYVLGDPNYYNRFGFLPHEQVVPPYALPEEWFGAWQSLSLKKLDQPLHGKLRVPPAWDQRTLWAP